MEDPNDTMATKPWSQTIRTRLHGHLLRQTLDIYHHHPANHPGGAKKHPGKERSRETLKRTLIIKDDVP